jgi:hypothetical protein
VVLVVVVAADQQQVRLEAVAQVVALPAIPNA